MTPERQETIRKFLGELSAQIEPRLKREDIDHVDRCLTELQDVMAGNRTLTEVLGEMERKAGSVYRGRGERFYAAAAALTLSTYLSRVEIE